MYQCVNNGTSHAIAYLVSFPSQLGELYTLLNENYVEDDDMMFRFDYSADFLKW